MQDFSPASWFRYGVRGQIGPQGAGVERGGGVRMRMRMGEVRLADVDASDTLALEERWGWLFNPTRDRPCHPHKGWVGCLQRASSVHVLTPSIVSISLLHHVCEAAVGCLSSRQNNASLYHYREHIGCLRFSNSSNSMAPPKLRSHNHFSYDALNT